MIAMNDGTYILLSPEDFKKVEKIHGVLSATAIFECDKNVLLSISQSTLESSILMLTVLNCPPLSWLFLLYNG